MSKLKLKGCYVYGEHLEIHKNHSMQIVAKVACMILSQKYKKEDILSLLKASDDPFDFLITLKVNRTDILFIGEDSVQKTSRVLVTKNGEYVTKLMPPSGVYGHYKKRVGVDKAVYLANDNTRWSPEFHSGKAIEHNTRSGGVRYEYRKLDNVSQEVYEAANNTVFNFDLHQHTGKTHQERLSSLVGGNKVTLMNDHPTLIGVDYKYYAEEVLKLIW